MLIDLAQPWKLPIPLIEGQGNFGSRGNDPPASAYYTEARLSPAGQVALAAEHGEIAPVPIGLINGNTHRQGTRPPFRPAAVIEAVRQVLRRPRLTAKQIADIIGPPDFLTGCTVTGDLAGLIAGRRTELGLQARVTVTDAAQVKARVAKAAIPGYPAPQIHQRDVGRLVIVLENFTARDDYWFVCVPDAGTPAEVLRDQLMDVYGVTIYVSVGLPRPLATMIRTWTRTHQHEDLNASLTALESALASRHQKRLMARP